MVFLKKSINYLSYINLKALDTIQPQHKPHLEGSKPSAEWYLPVSKVGSDVLMLVLEIDWIHVESVNQKRAVSDPQCRAVEVNEQPLVWVEVERVGVLYSVQ
jgi:hypothetical protein